jgi:2-haloacid dehalogenase
VTIEPRGWEILTFDCYGTLVDWEQGLGQALETVLRPHGVTAARDELLERFAQFEQEAEHGPHQSYRAVLAQVSAALGVHYGVPLAADDLAFLSGSLPDWPLFDDTVDALGRLAERYRLGILSNIDDDLFAATSRHLGVAFDPIVTAEQVGSYKPSQAGFEALLERVAVPSRRLLHVAQSIFHDIAPATALGINCVWVDRRRGQPGGATPSSSMEPKWRVDSLAELADLLLAD